MRPVTIATHNGNFHADDVFSVAALSKVFPNYNLIRTRDKAVLETADIVLDVGGQYDAENDLFDHHQRGGAGERENGIPFSSFGLVWAKYGLDICDGNQRVANSVDAGLVSTIDADDCGYTKEVCEGISISRTIGSFNLAWNEEGDCDEHFKEAVSFATRLIDRFIASANGSAEAKEKVMTAIEAAEDPSIIVLPQFVPWKKTVLSQAPDALYVVYPSQTGQWKVQTVPVELGSFENKKDLPEQWGGFEGEAIQQITGLSDAIFCHNGLFVAGAETFESALAMAKMALDQ